MTPDWLNERDIKKKAELFPLHAQLTSLGDELRETKEENIFHRHITLQTPL